VLDKVLCPIVPGAALRPVRAGRIQSEDTDIATSGNGPHHASTRTGFIG
jgi:hypothetical protein